MKDATPTIIRVEQRPCSRRPGYVASVSVDVYTGRVVAAAPILRWAIGQKWDEIKERGRAWGWRLTRIKATEPTIDTPNRIGGALITGGLR